MTKVQNITRLSVALALTGFGLLAGAAGAEALPTVLPSGSAGILSGSAGMSAQQPTCPPLPGTGAGSVAGALTGTAPSSPIICPLDATTTAPVASPLVITQSGAAALQVVGLLEGLGIPPLSAELPFGSVLPCPSVSAAPGTVCPM